MATRILVWLLVLLPLPLVTGSQNELRVFPSSCDSEIHSRAVSQDVLDLDDALRTLASNETILLEPGEHCVQNFSLVLGLSNISLVGVSSDVTIQCREGQGLAFANISSLSFRNITIHGCGLTGQPLNKTLTRLMHFLDAFIQIPDAAKISVLLWQIESLSMEHVTVSNTSGLGLVGVNVIGNSSLTEIEFSYNIRPGTCVSIGGAVEIGTNTPDLIGGGAFFVYYDYKDHRLQCEPPRMVIDQGRFLHNSECTYSLALYVNYDRSRSIQKNGYSLASGGGLAVVFAQRDYGADFKVRSSLFQNNTARYGGGANIQTFSGVKNTHVTFESCSFLRNGFMYKDAVANSVGTFSDGAGGMLVVQELYRVGLRDQPYRGSNRFLLVEILNSNFSENGARTGGALMLYSLRTPGVRNISDVPRVLLHSCVFTQNTGPIGGALWIYEEKVDGLNLGTLVELRDIRMENNTVRPVNSSITLSQYNTAVADIRGVNLTISGTSYIRNNLGTGLQATSTVVGIDVNATVYLEKNIGVYGGAMTFLSFSYLVMNANSSLYLRDNTARSQGGAFYVNIIAGSAPVGYADCFLYFSYNDFSVCDEKCADLNSTGVYIEIAGNTAVDSGSISYGSSLECPWAVELRRQRYDDGTVFRTLNRYFPTVFNFSEDPSTPDVVSTPPRKLTIHDPQPMYSTVPGGAFILNVTATDGFNNPIESILGSYPLTVDGHANVDMIRNTQSYVGQWYAFITGPNNSIQAGVLSSENRTVTVVIYSIDCLSVAQEEITIDVGFCPSGFLFNNKTEQKCVCDDELMNKGITCSLQNLYLSVPDGRWYGPLWSNSDERVIHGCVSDYCEPGTRKISVQNSLIDYDVQCKSGSNRGGFLCGSCRDGYSIALGSQRCLKCNNSYIGLIVLFLALGILMIVMISYLQITLTGGYLNGVLFFSNTVSLYGPLLLPVFPYGGLQSPASFLSLNLGFETCFHSKLTALEKVWWQLSFPLYLIFLMLLIGGLARFFKWKRRAGFSTIQGIATLLILCYVSVLQSSVELLGFLEIKTLSGKSEMRWVIDPTIVYFGSPHAFLAVVAICLLILYIIPLPLCLLFPQLLYRYRYVRNLKPFYDAFWDPFEPRFRFWLGLRLIVRWITTTCNFLRSDPQDLFLTAVVLVVLLFFQLLYKPFKGYWRNVIDGFFLVDLIILFLGSLYFRALESDREYRKDDFRHQATYFSVAFLMLAYVGFLVVLVYHIKERFPRLEQMLKYYLSTRIWGKKTADAITKSYDEISSQSNSSLLQEQVQRISKVTFSELREPLLEDAGSINIVNLPAKHHETKSAHMAP